MNDLHSDGKRFLMTKPVESADDEFQAKESTAEKLIKIIVVTYWFEDLKERMPVD